MATNNISAMRSVIQKIVYFDQGSATDYIQLSFGGAVHVEEEQTDKVNDEGQIEVSSKLSLGSKLMEIIGLDAKVGVGASLGTAFGSENVVKSIVTNTVLTDFFAAIEERGTECAIECFGGFRILPIENTLSYMALLSPYLSMLRSGQGIPAGDFSLSLEKIDSTINSAKGYFEFLGMSIENPEKKIVFRFNGSSFKNNYRAPDLTRMNLEILAVKVGDTRLSDLSIDSELNIERAKPSSLNPDFPGKIQCGEDKSSESDPELPMYDVILAGVKFNGE